MSQSFIIIVPGLTVTSEQFELVRDAAERHAPDLGSYTWEMFTDPRRWNLIPDDQGMPGKGEHVLIRSQERSLKANLWMRPDLRGNGEPKPHDHPWFAESEILAGGYSETRYVLSGSIVKSTDMSHRAGESNELPLSVFHEVGEIHEPGNTLTWFETGPGAQSWGYLDPDTGSTLDHHDDPDLPEFLAMLTRLNPQHVDGQYA